MSPNLSKGRHCFVVLIMPRQKVEIRECARQWGELERKEVTTLCEHVYWALLGLPNGHFVHVLKMGANVYDAPHSAFERKHSLHNSTMLFPLTILMSHFKSFLKT